jgi:hypothetical protein
MNTYARLFRRRWGTVVLVVMILAMILAAAPLWAA